MQNQASIKSLFPREQEIPTEYRMLAPIHQAITLLDGELVPAKDGVRKVFSPICVQDNDGLRQLEIGSIPVGSLDEAANALQAAVSAYDRGRGPKVKYMLDCIKDAEAKGARVLNEANSGSGVMPTPMLPDADLDLAVNECLLGALSFNGQR
jgi:hypothetical protein